MMMRAMAKGRRLFPQMDVEDKNRQVSDCFAVDEWNFQNSQHRFEDGSGGGSPGKLEWNGRPTWCGIE